MHRYLPATFRELWDELKEKYKKEGDQNHLGLVKSLLTIFKYWSSNNSYSAGDQGLVGRLLLLLICILILLLTKCSASYLKAALRLQGSLLNLGGFPQSC